MEGPAVKARAFPTGQGSSQVVGLTERPSAAASARQRSDTTQTLSGRSPGRNHGSFLPRCSPSARLDPLRALLQDQTSPLQEIFKTNRQSDAQAHCRTPERPRP